MTCKLPFVHDSWGSFDELPVCGISQNQVRVTQVFHVLDVFWCKLQLLQPLNSSSFLSCPAIPSAERLLQPWAEYRPRQVRMKRMSIMMKYMTLRPGDKFFRVKKRCEQKWSIYFVEFNVTPDLVFDSLYLPKLPFLECHVCISFTLFHFCWNDLSFMIHCVAVDLGQCQVSIRIYPQYASTNQRKNPTKERELNDSSTFFCQRPMNWEWWALLSGVWGRASRKPGTYRCTSQAWAFTLRDSHCGYHGAKEKSDFEMEDEYRIL